MRTRLLPLLLLCTAPAAFADTIYRWVDDSGQAHYTDDRKSIPKGARVAITQGDDLGLIWTRNPDAQLPTPPTPPPGKASAQARTERTAAGGNVAPATPAPAASSPAASTPAPAAPAPAPTAPAPTAPAPAPAGRR